MAVTGHDVFKNTPLTIQDVRDAIRDYPEYNLLEGEQTKAQFTDDEIERALNWAVRWFNGIPPVGIAVSRDAIPELFHHVVLEATLLFLIRAYAHYQLRNATNAPEGVFNKYQYYFQLADNIESKLLSYTKDQKIAANKALFFGSVGSGHRAPW